jgi:hypothetical protein
LVGVTIAAAIASRPWSSLDLPSTATAGKRVELTLPGNANLAPPGSYMVFAIDSAGVPSVGRWLRLG